MKLEKKEIQIIKLLVSASTFMSSYSIAEYTQINRRLVRDEMNHIKVILQALGYILVSKASKGYLIEPIFPNTLHDLAVKIEQFEQAHYSEIPTLPVERENYIIRRLLNTNDFIKIDVLAQELLISRSSVSNDLKNVRITLKKSNLIIKQKPNYGLKIYGKEIDCRKPLVDIFFLNFTDSAMFYDLLRYSNEDNQVIETIILQIIEDFNIEISDVSLCDFLLCVSVSITRMRLGFFLDVTEDIEDIKERIEFLAAKKMATSLETKLGFCIPLAEVRQIGIELVSKRSPTHMIPYQRERSIRLATESLEEIYQRTRIDLRDQRDFWEELIRYNQGTLLRQRFNTKLRNPLYLEIQQKYALGYELARIISVVFQKNGHFPLSLSELSYFAIMLNTALNSGIQAKKKVLLICGLSNGTTQLIDWQIKQRFGNEIMITNTTQYYKLHHEDLSVYDFIISTIPIHDTLPIPCLHINPIMDDDDFNIIDNYLAYTFYNHGIETCFHPKLFNADVHAKRKTEVMNTFYKLFKQQFTLKDSSLKNALTKNKGLMIYEYDNLISIIRYSKPINQSNTVSIIINDKALPGYQKDVQIFILIAFKERDEPLANAITNAFIQLSQDQEAVQEILASPSYHNFIRIVQNHK
jgi:transcriptional antiterminator/mannitol/fructose-specific phosphotransferase system IIA component (Ntr-type)